MARHDNIRKNIRNEAAVIPFKQRHLRIALATLILAAASPGPARAAPCVSGLTTGTVVGAGAVGYSCNLGLATYTFNDNIAEWTSTTIHFAAPRSTAMGLYMPPGQTTGTYAPNEVHRVTFEGFTNPDGSSSLSYLGGFFTFEVEPNRVAYFIDDGANPVITHSGPPLSSGIIEGYVSPLPPTTSATFTFRYTPDLDADDKAIQILTALYAEFTIVPLGWTFAYDIPTSVPEPGPLALLLSGLVVLLICRAARPG